MTSQRPWLGLEPHSEMHMSSAAYEPRKQGREGVRRVRGSEEWSVGEARVMGVRARR